MRIEELRKKLEGLNERQWAILLRVYADSYNSITLEELSKQVSGGKRTILRDLATLEDMGLIYRYNSWITFIEPIKDRKLAKVIEVLVKRHFGIKP